MRSDAGVRYSRNPDLLWSAVDGETVMLSIERGEYFGVGGAGSRIWELVAAPVTAEEICACLVAEFDVDADVCRADLAAFLDDLLAADVVRQC